MASLLTRCLALVATASVALSANAAAISGVVTDFGSGRRLPSMIVSVYTASGIDAGILVTTDSNGRYAIGLSRGDYRILAYDQNGVYATSFAGDAESFETSPALKVADADIPEYNFALRLGGTVTGRVVSGSGLVSGAVVAAYNLSGTRRGFTTADAAANYSIVLPPGRYKLVAYDDGKVYAPAFYSFAATFDAATEVEAVAGRATPAIDFSLLRAGRLTGFVVDTDTGAAVSGLIIAVYDQSGSLVTTQQMTKDQFDLALAPGTYRLVVADPTHQYAPEFFGGAPTFDQSTPLTIGSSELRSGVEFQVVRAAHIRGRIVNISEAPLKDITVAAYNLDGSLRTSVKSGVDGAYQLDVPTGLYKIVLFDEGLVYAPQFYSAASDFQSATAIVADIQQDLSLNFRMAAGGNITGIAKDDSTKATLASVTVGAYDAAGQLVASGKTNDAGAYKLVVPDGSYRLVASDPSLRYAAGYTGGASAFELSPETHVQAGSVSNVDFNLAIGVLVTGTVTDMAQHLVTGVDIAILDLNGNRVATARSLSGRFEVVLLPGTYKLAALDPQNRYLVSFYDGVSTLEGAKPVTIQKGTSPPPIGFILAPAPKRRAARH
ncbi:MAG: hypothetical protein ACXV7D_02320 [Thermoanaerobaculia bacterium]